MINRYTIFRKWIFLRIRLRSYFWSKLFKTNDRSLIVYGHITVENPGNIILGTKVCINEGCHFNARAEINIGNYVYISSHTIIHTGSLSYEKPMDTRDHKKEPVTIEDGVWIGSGSIILPGVVIGKNAVVAAGAVVTKNVPPYSIVAGVPARVLRNIPQYGHE